MHAVISIVADEQPILWSVLANRCDKPSRVVPYRANVNWYSRRANQPKVAGDTTAFFWSGKVCFKDVYPATDRGGGYFL